jgi:hypothetical protein
MARRQCAYCGTFVSETEKTCPNCREALLERIELHSAPHGGPEIRRGLLCMLLAVAIYYLAAPQSIVPIPFHIPPMVTTYLLPLLFLLGLGFTIFGAMRRIGIL